MTDGAVRLTDEPGLHVHTAVRADALVDALGDLLVTSPPPDPFTPEIVAVPTRGVERWVAQRLSHRLGATSRSTTLSGPPDGEAGVAANLSFESPGRLVHRVVAAASGIDPDTDPWSLEHLTWHVLAAVDAAVAAGEAWAAPLARALVDEPGDRDAVRSSRRLRLARDVAGLFTAYATQRPALVRSWAAGPGADGRDDDGYGEPVPADLAWQPPLWRAVRAAVGLPDLAERLGAATAALVADPGVVDLPARIAVLGPTRLPEAHLEVLAALGVHRAVHVGVPHPSRALWEATAALGVAPGARRRTVARNGRPTPGAPTTDDPTGGATDGTADLTTVAHHPFLASTAADATELAARLAARATTVTHHGEAPGRSGARPETGAATALHALQASLAADVPPDRERRVPVAAGDRSVQVHACHGRARQVEVLREAVLGALADDPTLEPRDVVVLCPDVEAFAPLVVAAFGAAPATPGAAGAGPEDDPGVAPPHPGRTLRVRVADRSPARANPVLRVLDALLELAGSRVTATQVVDLAGLDAVRRRFGLDDEALDRVRTWAATAGTHWGEDLARRDRFGLARVGDQGTWASTLDRLLLGVAVADEHDRYLGTAVPVDDVSSTDAVLAGRFAELVDRLTGLLAALSGEHPAPHWFDTLDRALVLLCAAEGELRWQEIEARTVLSRARAAAAGSAAPLRLADVRALLAPLLAGRPTRAGFRTGALTVCSLEPMRAVPHRVVCVLGLDSDAFPRTGAASGDDLLARDPVVGERDRRTEDRQIFLDAVTAATDRLVLLYSGASERTGAVLAPAAPLAELLDALDDVVVSPLGDARTAFVVHQPLQVVDERNFTPGALGRPGPFSFDEIGRRAAEAARRPRTPPPPLLPRALPPPAPEDDDGVVRLDELVAALENPARALVRTRLGISMPRDEPELDDALPLALDGLDRWQVGDRLLRARLDGRSVRRAGDVELRRGTLPPRTLGQAELAGIQAEAEAVHRGVEAELRAPVRVVDVAVPLPDGRRVEGTVDDVHGTLLVRARYSRLGPKDVLRAWVTLVALAANEHPGPAVAGAVVAGRGAKTPGQAVAEAAVRRLRAPDPATARRILAGLVAVADRALREPVPFWPAVSERYAAVRLTGVAPEAALGRAASLAAGGFDLADDHSTLVHGAGNDLPTVAAARAGVTEPTMFGDVARQVWEAALAHEILEEDA